MKAIYRLPAVLLVGILILAACAPQEPAPAPEAAPTEAPAPAEEAAPIEETDEDKEAKREEDRLLVDPVAAYAAQIEQRLSTTEPPAVEQADADAEHMSPDPLPEVEDEWDPFEDG